MTAWHHSSLSAVDDSSEYHFTGKERDAESGNDYFGARYYASTMGRFLVPDWSAKVMPVPYAKLGDPQSLNLYDYVENNPLSRNDPNGHLSCADAPALCAAIVDAVSHGVDAGKAIVAGAQAYARGDFGPLPGSGPKSPGPPPMKGVNPITGETLFSRDPKGQPGHERPGVGGAGNFGAHRDNATGTPHQGEDISAPDGADIHASTSGTVTFSGTKKGYGNTVEIDDGNGTVTLYAHNSENGVSVGDFVNQGDVIGSVGQTGNAAGQPASEEHLHFGVLVNGTFVDPANWLDSATNPQ